MNEKLKLMQHQGELMAYKKLHQLLSSPNYLEDLDSTKSTAEKQKNISDCRLNDHMQRQFESIRLSKEMMMKSLSSIDEIKKKMGTISENYTKIVPLENRFIDLKKSARSYSQYRRAKDDLKQILDVNKIVEDINNQMDDMHQLLIAHHSLMELDHTKNVLLSDIYPNKDHRNKVLKYFSSLPKLYEKMEKKIFKGIISVYRSAAVNNSELLVTAIRIIEREEAQDALWETKKNELMQKNPSVINHHSDHLNNDFDSNDHQYYVSEKKNENIFPLRPLKWKEKCFDYLQERMVTVVNGVLLKPKEEELWLVSHIQLLRTQMLNELIPIKRYVVNLLPPYYDIMNQMTKFIYFAIADHLKEIADAGTLDKLEPTTMLCAPQEIVSVLKQPELRIDPKFIDRLTNERSLLSYETSNKLIDIYHQYVRQNFNTWSINAINIEKNDWYNSKRVELNGNSKFYTTLPILVSQMLDEHLNLASTIESYPKCLKHILNGSLEFLKDFFNKYHNTLLEFRNDHFKSERAKSDNYTHHLIAALNNVDIFKYQIHQMAKKYSHVKLEEQIVDSSIVDKLTRLQKLIIHLILDEIRADLTQHLRNIMTPEWFDMNQNVVVERTVADYYEDYSMLHPYYITIISRRLQLEIFDCFITSISSSKAKDLFPNISHSLYESPGEIKRISTTFKNTFDSVQGVFSRSEKLLNDESTNYLSILPILGELLSSTETIFKFLIDDLIKRFPSVNENIIKDIVNYRGDIDRPVYEDFISQLKENYPPLSSSNHHMEQLTKNTFNLLLTNGDYSTNNDERLKLIDLSTENLFFALNIHLKEIDEYKLTPRMAVVGLNKKIAQTFQPTFLAGNKSSLLKRGEQFLHPVLNAASNNEDKSRRNSNNDSNPVQPGNPFDEN
ncbi:hypothetical protein SNEBB_002223 [Seison nebaliae]|nr:hypothetical protein SNEBB_002223 [Seison nebaliae]